MRQKRAGTASVNERYSLWSCQTTGSVAQKSSTQSLVSDIKVGLVNIHDNRTEYNIPVRKTQITKVLGFIMFNVFSGSTIIAMYSRLYYFLSKEI